MGLVLGLSVLTLCLIVFSNGKAVLEESPGHHEGTPGYIYSLRKGNVKPHFRYDRLKYDLAGAKKKHGYYNPRINGQPIYVPQISLGTDKVTERNKMLQNYVKLKASPEYEISQDSSQLDEFAPTPTATNNYDQKGKYYENPGILNSMIKNIHGKIYENKVYCRNCHFTTEYNQRNLHGLNPNMHVDDEKSIGRTSTDMPGLNPYKKGKENSQEESSEKAEEFLYSDISRASDENYEPEVVDVINRNLYESRENLNIATFPNSEYDRPLVKEVLTKKGSETSVKGGKKSQWNGPYTNENLKSLKKVKNDIRKTWLELLPMEPIDGIDYTTDPVSAKTSDKKIVQKASFTGSQSVYDYAKMSTSHTKMSEDEEESVLKANEFSNLETSSLKTETEKPKKSNLKKCSQITSEIANVNSNCVENQPEASTERTEVDEDRSKTASMKAKLRYSSVNYEYYPEGDDDMGLHKESTLETEHPGEKSNYENLDNLSDEFFEDQFTKLPDSEHIKNTNEPFNVPRKIENEIFDGLGSGSVMDEDTSDLSRSLYVSELRRLSWLNSNIWPLIFNPNAEEHELNKCFTRNNDTGYCRYLQNCPDPNIASLEQLLSHACVLDEVFIGVCCPEFPVETIKVHWEQDKENTKEEKVEHKFSHDIYTEDCGARSEAFGTQSCPSKAQLVSMSNGKIFCGGVMIDEQYILTAAHCTTKVPKNQILVRLWQRDLSGEDFAVIEIKRHAQYNSRTMLNDIALLKLGRIVTHNKNISFVCLPKETNDKDAYSGTKGILLGWQVFSDENSGKRELLEVMTSEECKKSLKVNVPDSVLCTEARNEDGRICNADSGTPLIIEDGGRYKVIGILSWNRNDCDRRFPSTFSRVSSFIGWIRKHAV